MNRTTRIPGGPLVLAAALAAALLAPGRAAAHDLKAEVNADADPVRVVAGFDDDTPAEGAKVTVTDAAGAVVAAGVTDERGVWTFPRPGPGTYRVVVEGVGHRDAVTLRIPEAGGPAEVTGRFRFEDKRVGLSVGLAVLLGAAGLYALRLRRRK